MAEYKGNNNLIGQVFGKLTVLEYNGNSKWICQCECGNKTIVGTSKLTGNRTKSCGCLRGQNTKGNIRNMGPRVDITGKRFGKLIPIKYVKGGFWNCQCDCGNIIKVDTRHLNNGHTQSCGCLLKEKNQSYIKDMNQFENETIKVLEFAGSNEQSVALWKCLCKVCGNTFITRGASIRAGQVRSCGCVHSFNEQVITKLLIQNQIEFATQYTFPDLKGVGGKSLRFDFAVFNQGVLSHLIEYNGKQHYEKVKGKWGEKFEIQQKNDLLKQEYCKKNNIELRIIRYDQQYTLEDLI